MRASDGRQSWTLTLMVCMYVLCAVMALSYFYVDYKFRKTQTLVTSTPPTGPPAKTSRRKMRRSKTSTSSSRSNHESRKLIIYLLGVMLVVSVMLYLLSHGEGRFMVNMIAAWKGNSPYQGQDPVRAAVAEHLTRDIESAGAIQVLLMLEGKTEEEEETPSSGYGPITEDDQ